MPRDVLELYGPFAYSAVWVPLAVGAAVAALVLPALGWWLTRARRPRPAAVAAARPVDLRADALAQIEATRQAHQRGEIGDREAHSRLSQVVRGYVAGVTGGDVDAMTLDELRAEVARNPRLAPVAEFVAAVYPPTFAPGSAREVQRSLAQAYEVVSRWS